MQHTTPHKNHLLLCFWWTFYHWTWLALLLDQHPPNIGHMAHVHETYMTRTRCKLTITFLVMTFFKILAEWKQGAKSSAHLHPGRPRKSSDSWPFRCILALQVIHLKVHLLVGGKTILKETLNILGFYLRGDSRCRHSLSKFHINGEISGKSSQLWHLRKPNPMGNLGNLWEYIYPQRAAAGAPKQYKSARRTGG